MKYDIVIVGSGITAATIAALAEGRRILLMDNHDFGGIYRTENMNDIEVFKYGPYIVHTDDMYVWNFLNGYSQMLPYIHRSKSIVEDQTYSFPINLDTYQRLYHADSPEYARELLTENGNWSAEEYLLEKIGDDLYDKFYHGYLWKAWGMDPRQLPAYIIQHIPVRISYNDFMYDNRYQGVPSDGYTTMLERMTSHCDVQQMDFNGDKDYYESLAPIVVYTGSVDEYFDYELGELPYRSFEYHLSIEPTADYQGIAQVNFPDEEVVYTRSIEHKHIHWVDTPTTIVTQEIPRRYKRGGYLLRVNSIPIQSNIDLYDEYVAMEHKAIFAGRMGTYRNMNIEQCVLHAMDIFENNIRLKL
jgi:UDP-galactopyranose mutase